MAHPTPRLPAFTSLHHIFRVSQFQVAMLTLATALALSIFQGTPAHAITPQGNAARFDECQRLKSEGRWNWSGVATGTSRGYGGFNGRTGFHVRACFATRNACEAWVRNIYNELEFIDTLRNARCIARR